MIALIDLYQKELLKVNGFSPFTVETYTLSINAFFRFAKNELKIDPVNVNGPQLLKWILYLKNTGTRGASACAARRIQPNRKSSLCAEKLFCVLEKIREYPVESGTGPAAFDYTQATNHKTNLNPKRF